jgi:hypothetical protein
VGAVFLRLGDEEPVWFQPLAYVPIDSGVGCFAAPDAAWRLVDGGDAAAEAVERSLAAVAQPTWAAAGDEDHVAFSTGLGAGLYDLSLGFSDADELVQVALTMLPDGSDAGTPTPAAGQQRAALVPLTMSGPPSPDNAVVLPAEARRRLTAAHRRAVRAWVEGARVETSFLPEYGSDPDVPVRIAIDVRAGPHSFSETIETSPAP